MSHNPNPFDFVPFANKKPELKTTEQWLALGNLKTGRITVALKALTPVHIVGVQPMNGQNIHHSLFYQRHDTPYIPGSSLRGVLRAFIEAACNGWASQLTPYYQEEKKRHTYGFKVLEQETPKDAKIFDLISELPAVDEPFCVPGTLKEGMDLASFLFGYVPGKSEGKDLFNTAWKGRITIDDVAVKPSQLSPITGNNTHTIPDLLNKSAFMGGPRPSASSWWYQKPYTIIEDVYDGLRLIGSGFRGRKFYFHQDSNKCIEYYNNSNDWNNLYFFPIQCLEKGCSVSFDLLFNNIPEQLLNIVMFTLEPGMYIRHKIGYGKAYGYGSIELSVKEVVFQGKGYEDAKIVDHNALLRNIYNELLIYNEQNKEGITHFIHMPSLQFLSFMLWFDHAHLFTYPDRGRNGFNHAMNNQDRDRYENTINDFMEDNNLYLEEPLTESQGLDISERLYPIKPALNFKLYQQRSRNDIYIKLNKQRSWEANLTP
jgi:CRISPR/Cas system CSM-associated protein Csm3 (group 7 of RAMP superfamily)